jgi:hypothetical protein
MKAVFLPDNFVSIRLTAHFVFSARIIRERSIEESMSPHISPIRNDTTTVDSREIREVKSADKVFYESMNSQPVKSRWK